MTQTAYQTVRLSKGRHDSPDRGACVMELASMLAGERFTDHPRSVCPVIAGFLRGYNDLLPDGQHDELYAYASLVVGTRASRAVRRRRARRILEWGRPRTRRRRAPVVRLQPWDFVLLPTVEAALRMDPDRRRAEIRALVEELCAKGGAGETAARAAVPAPAEPARCDPAAADAAEALARSAGPLGAPAAGFSRRR